MEASDRKGNKNTRILVVIYQPLLVIENASAIVGGKLISAERVGVNSFKVDLSNCGYDEYLTSIKLYASPRVDKIALSLEIPSLVNQNFIRFGLRELHALNVTKQFVGGFTEISIKKELGIFDTGREGISLALMRKFVDRQGNRTLNRTLIGIDGTTARLDTRQEPCAISTR